MQILGTSANWIIKIIIYFFVGSDEDKIRLIWYIHHIVMLAGNNTIMLFL
jgi:hypothetical protein